MNGNFSFILFRNDDNSKMKIFKNIIKKNNTMHGFVSTKLEKTKKITKMYIHSHILISKLLRFFFFVFFLVMCLFSILLFTNSLKIILFFFRFFFSVFDKNTKINRLFLFFYFSISLSTLCAVVNNF